MTDRPSIDDSQLIRFGLEGTLALRWAELLEEEPHKRAMPRGTIKKQRLGLGVDPAKHHNTIRMEENAEKVWHHLCKGPATVTELVEATGLGRNAVQRALNRAKKNGKAKSSRKRGTGSDPAIWQAIE